MTSLVGETEQVEIVVELHTFVRDISDPMTDEFSQSPSETWNSIVISTMRMFLWVP
jgi:hypothetical protein